MASYFWTFKVYKFLWYVYLSYINTASKYIFIFDEGPSFTKKIISKQERNAKHILIETVDLQVYIQSCITTKAPISWDCIDRIYLTREYISNPKKMTKPVKQNTKTKQWKICNAHLTGDLQLKLMTLTFHCNGNLHNNTRQGCTLVKLGPLPLGEQFQEESSYSLFYHGDDLNKTKVKVRSDDNVTNKFCLPLSQLWRDIILLQRITESFNLLFHFHDLAISLSKEFVQCPHNNSFSPSVCTRSNNWAS